MGQPHKWHMTICRCTNSLIKTWQSNLPLLSIDVATGPQAPRCASRVGVKGQVGKVHQREWGLAAKSGSMQVWPLWARLISLLQP